MDAEARRVWRRWRLRAAAAGASRLVVALLVAVAFVLSPDTGSGQASTPDGDTHPVRRREKVYLVLPLCADLRFVLWSWWGKAWIRAGCAGAVPGSLMSGEGCWYWEVDRKYRPESTQGVLLRTGAIVDVRNLNYIAGRRQVTRVELDDGSTIWLTSRSRNGVVRDLVTWFEDTSSPDSAGDEAVMVRDEALAMEGSSSLGEVPLDVPPRGLRERP
jgi:hypothetical protein